MFYLDKTVNSIFMTLCNLGHQFPLARKTFGQIFRLEYLFKSCFANSNHYNPTVSPVVHIINSSSSNAISHKF